MEEPKVITIGDILDSTVMRVNDFPRPNSAPTRIKINTIYNSRPRCHSSNFPPTICKLNSSPCRRDKLSRDFIARLSDLIAEKKTTWGMSIQNDVNIVSPSLFPGVQNKLSLVTLPEKLDHSKNSRRGELEAATVYVTRHSTVI